MARGAWEGIWGGNGAPPSYKMVWTEFGAFYGGGGGWQGLWPGGRGGGAGGENGDAPSHKMVWTEFGAFYGGRFSHKMVRAQFKSFYGEECPNHPVTSAKNQTPTPSTFESFVLEFH